MSRWSKAFSSAGLLILLFSPVPSVKFFFFSNISLCGALLCGSRERPLLCAEAYAARRESGGGGSLPASATASAAAPHSRLHALPAAHLGFVCYGGAAAAAHR